MAQVFIPYGFWSTTTTLSVTPSGTPQYIIVGDTLSYSAAGGSGSYAWSNTNGAATLSSASGTPVDYTADTVYSSDTLTITSGTSTVNISIKTYDSLSMTPTVSQMAISTTQDFAVVNGYCTGVPGACTDVTATWSIVSGGGTISSVGLFTAPGTAGTTVIQVADSIGNTYQQSITIASTLTISSANMVSKTLKLPVYSSAYLTATLGTVPYTYSLLSGSGTVGCSGMTLTNTNINNTTTNVASTGVSSTTNCPSRGLFLVGTEQICYTSTTGTTYVGNTFSGTGLRRACNGTVNAAHANGAAVNSNVAYLIAPSSTGTASVRVTDSLGASSDATITYISPVEVANGYYHTCVRYNEGSVKCWGENSKGGAGVGSTAVIGDTGSALGGWNSFVNLGGVAATKIVSGFYHSCALLSNSVIKCWGDNTYGQIGDASTTQRTSPVTVTAPGGKTATNIWAFGYNTCALYSDNTASCWGDNSNGQVGQGNTTTPVNSPSTTYLSFGGGRYPTKISGSLRAACAVLDNATVQCWGYNASTTNGNLGYGDTTARNAPTGTAINLGGGRTAVDISGSTDSTTTTTRFHFCVALDDGSVKCWGYNSNNQLGDGTTTGRNTPTATTTLGFLATKIYAGREFNCASTSTGGTRCWGRNSNGQLLVGNTTTLTDASGTTGPFCKGNINAVILAAGTTTITLSATAATDGCFTAGGKIIIDSEIICYTGTSGSTLTGATRGCDGTTDTSHAVSTAFYGLVNWGTGVSISSMSLMGRAGCAITGNGTANNNRIKCWGNNLDSGSTKQSGLFLFHMYHTTASTTSYLGDATTELGDGLPFVDH